MGEGLAWFTRAECRGMDTNLFFPSNGDFSAVLPICNRCPVRQQCLNFALRQTVDSYGMFGGCTPFERDTMRWKRMMG